MSGRIKRKNPSFEGYRSRSESHDGDDMRGGSNQNLRGGRKRPRGGQNNRRVPENVSNTGNAVSNINADFPELQGLQQLRPDLLAIIEERGNRAEVEQAGYKDCCDIFIGNFGSDVAPNVMRDFLATAMFKLGFCRNPHEDPVRDCRMNKNFCFIEFNSRAACAKALNLNGIPFRGNHLRISRPNKYDGPSAPSMNWSQIAPPSYGSEAAVSTGYGGIPNASPRHDAGSGFFPGGSGAVGGTVSSSGIPGSFAPDGTPTGSVPDPATKQMRELFLGNTDGERTLEADLQAFLGGALQKMGMSHSGIENPLYLVRVNGRYGFLETRNAADAANLLNFNGITFRGTKLRICRPSKFDCGIGGEKYFAFDELRFRWQQGDLKLMTAGPPSRILIVTNMATLTELQNVDIYLDIIEDTRLECSLYGSVKSVLVPRSSDQQGSGTNVLAGIGKVFIEMGSVEHATNVLLALKGRMFNNRTIDVKFYPEDLFRSMNYTYVHPEVIVTKSNGAMSMDKIYTPYAMSRIMKY